MIDVVIDTYNKGISKSNLMEFSINKSFIKALEFTGTHKILNDILNREQLLILQKSWLRRNTYHVRVWTPKCIKFVLENDWAPEFLIGENIDAITIIEKTQKDSDGLKS